MAILEHISGLEVTIEVDGVTAKEYDIPADEDGRPPEDISFHEPRNQPQGGPPPYSIKYIEAHSGKRFSFRVKRSPDFEHHSHHIGAKVQADQIRLKISHGPPISKSNPHADWNLKTSAWREFDTQNGYQSCYFCFVPLGTSEADVSAEEAKKHLNLVRGLGILRVSLYHMDESGGAVEKPIASPSYRSSINDIPEKCLKGKALDSYTSWDVQRSTNQNPLTYQIDKFQDNLQRPFAVFDFRYRSMDGLIKEGIVARPFLDDEVEELTDADARRLAKEYLKTSNAAGGSSRKVKREYEEVEPLDGESFRARYKTRRLKNGRFEVDLTDD